MHIARLGTACLLLIAMSGAANADIDSALVRRGMAAYDNLEFQKSIDLLDQALRETLTREERIATYRTLGFAYVGLDEVAKAKEAFDQLLRIDPEIELDRTVSPRIRSVFDEVQEAARVRAAEEAAPRPAAPEPVETAKPSPLPAPRPEVAVEINPMLPHEGRPLSFRARVDGTARAVLFHRVRGETSYSRIEAPAQAGAISIVLQGFAVRAPAVEYYVELLDQQGATLAVAGAPASPRFVEVARPRTVWKSPVLWGVLGGVVVAGAIVAGVVGGTAGTHDPAMVKIMVH